MSCSNRLARPTPEIGVDVDHRSLLIPLAGGEQSSHRRLAAVGRIGPEPVPLGLALLGERGEALRRGAAGDLSNLRGNRDGGQDRKADTARDRTDQHRNPLDVHQTLGRIDTDGGLPLRIAEQILDLAALDAARFVVDLHLRTAPVSAMRSPTRPIGPLTGSTTPSLMVQSLGLGPPGAGQANGKYGRQGGESRPVSYDAHALAPRSHVSVDPPIVPCPGRGENFDLLATRHLLSAGPRPPRCRAGRPPCGHALCRSMRVYSSERLDR